MPRRGPPILAARAAPAAASLRRRRATLNHGAFAVRVRILPCRGDRGGSHGRHGCRCSAMGHLGGCDRLDRSWLLGDPPGPAGSDAGSRPAGRSRCLSALFADVPRSRCGRRRAPRGREARVSGAHSWVPHPIRSSIPQRSAAISTSSARNADRRDARSKSQMRFPVVFLRRFAQNADGRAAD